MGKNRINISNMLKTGKYDPDILSIPKVSSNRKQNAPDRLYRALNNISIARDNLYNYKMNASSSQQQKNKNNGNLYLGAWVKIINNKLNPRNFGDDINFSFLPNLTEQNHVLYKKNIQGNITNYIMIGSILTDKFVNDNTIVWGSGMLRYQKLKNKPKKVCAVRGPLTRKVLLDSNIECPEVYGDPALLMPYYYYPYVQKKYKVGIIPHWSHIDSPLLNKFRNNEDIKIINFKVYTDWKFIIKQILSCDFIISESLHGLIIAEAYRIPNIWVTFGDIDQDFKYEDFFRSIGKQPYNAYSIEENTTLQHLLDLEKHYNPTNTLNLNNLVNACPVKLNNLNMDNRIKKYTGKVLLCCIGKLENLYIREFVEHHKNLGFDNICLYDNNDPDGEHFEDVIKDYIDSGYVILKNVRGKELAQMPSYTECYSEYKNKYDWIAFIDIDEFINLDDSGILKPNGDYSVKKFKSYLPMRSNAVNQTKPIIKTCLDNLEFTSAHGPVKDNRVKCVNTAGELCDNAIMANKPTWKNACLHHYRFKTIEEFVLGKMVRLWPTHYKNGGKSALNLNMFFKYNKKTNEKVQYAEKLLREHNISRNE